jgi:hypothetical protein
MALLGNAAMLLWYDIVPEAIDAHDEWHTREHLPERVAVPGFLRAQRWVAEAGSRRYFVVYEVSDIEVLTGGPYMERLNNPTPWTSRMMPNFRGMNRGFCNVEARHGTLLGTTALTVRYTSAKGREAQLAAWIEAKLAKLAQGKGVSSAFLLQSRSSPQMTKEQSIRGPDTGIDRVVLVTGHSAEAIRQLGAAELSARSMIAAGAGDGAIADVYALACQGQALA